MAWGQRVKAKVMGVFGIKEEETPNGDVEWQQGSKQVQYRLEATVRHKVPFWKKIITCGGFWGNMIHPASHVGINPNQRLAMYLHWMFRVNFGFLFAIMCAMFFALVIFFAALITIAGQMDEECVRIGGAVFDNEDTAFADAFALSWTTFSTVGYGETETCKLFIRRLVFGTIGTQCIFLSFHREHIPRSGLPKQQVRQKRRKRLNLTLRESRHSSLSTFL